MVINLLRAAPILSTKKAYSRFEPQLENIFEKNWMLPFFLKFTLFDVHLTSIGRYSKHGRKSSPGILILREI